MNRQFNIIEPQMADTIELSTVDSRYGQLAYQLNQVAQQHQAMAQLDGQFQLIEADNFVASSSSVSSSSSANSFRTGQYGRMKQLGQQQQQQYSGSDFHDTQIDPIKQACDFVPPNCNFNHNNRNSNSNNNVNNASNTNCNINANQQVQICVDPFITQPMPNRLESDNGHSIACDTNLDSYSNNRITLNDSQSIYVASIAQPNYSMLDQYNDLKLAFGDQPHIYSSSCSSGLQPTTQILPCPQLNQQQFQQQTTNDYDSDSSHEFQNMSYGQTNQPSGDYFCQSTINQLCSMDDNLNCSGATIGGFRQSQTDLYTICRRPQQVSQSSLSIASSEHLYELGPYDNQAPFSPLNCIYTPQEEDLQSTDNETPRRPNELTPMNNTTNSDSIDLNEQYLELNSRGNANFHPQASMASELYLPVQSSSASLLENGLERDQTREIQSDEVKHRSQNRMELIEMKTTWNFTQDWLDSICRQLIDHMNKFGICVIDNFLGSLRGDMVFKEVKQLYSGGQYMNGRLVSDRLANDRNSNTDPGAIRNDRVIWVDGNEDNCSEINNLIQTLSSVITNSSRLSLYSNNQLDKVVINRRTKAHVACYPGNGTRYVKHIDNPNGDGRLITSIYYLNKDWSTKREGGLLRMYPTGTNQVANIEPLFDRALFFWSDRRNPHEVLPAYRDRFAVTVWFIGEHR